MVRLRMRAPVRPGTPPQLKLNLDFGTQKQREDYARDVLQQVFTIEPGLYFIPMLLKKLKQSPHQSQVNWPLIDALMPYGGIRIEDNVVILNDQPVNLTRLALAEHRSA